MSSIDMISSIDILNFYTSIKGHNNTYDLWKKYKHDYVLITGKLNLFYIILKEKKTNTEKVAYKTRHVIQVKVQVNSAASAGNENGGTSKAWSVEQRRGGLVVGGSTASLSSRAQGQRLTRRSTTTTLMTPITHILRYYSTQPILTDFPHLSMWFIEK